MADSPISRLGLRTRLEFVLAGAVKTWGQWFPSALPAYQQAAAQQYVFGQPPTPSTAGPIPRIIWAYWNSRDLPLVVQRCIDGWRRLHPDWRIEILNDDSVHQHVSQWPDALAGVTVQKRSDWLRLELLRVHGGFWLDASTILTQPLDWVVQQQAATGSDFVGFYLQRFTHLPQFPVVESWFMAAPAGSAFIADVQQEFTREVIEQDAQIYVDALKAQGIYERTVQGIDSPLYLAIHVTMQRVLQSGQAAYRLDLWQAEQTAFLYHVQAKWNRAVLKRKLFFMPVRGAVVPLIKLRGPDRKRLDDYIARGLYLPDSIAGTYLMTQTGTDQVKEAR